MMKMKVYLQIVCFAILLLLPSSVIAAVQTVEADGVWFLTAGLEEDLNVARQRAYDDAKVRAAEKLSVYIEHTYTGKNNMFKQGETKTFAAAVLQVQSDEYARELVGGEDAYCCHIVVTADDAKVQALLTHEEQMKQAMQMLREKDEQIAELNRQMKEYGQQMKVAPTESQRMQIRQQVKDNESKFVALQLAERAEQMFWNIRVRQDKGMVVSQAEKEQLIALCNQAIVLDSACDYAYATLGLYYTYIPKDYETAFSVLKQGWANVPKKSKKMMYSSIERLFSSWSHGGGFEHSLAVRRKIVNTFPEFIKYFQMWANKPPKNHIDEVAQCFREFWEADPVGRYEQYYRLMTSFYRKTEGDERALECLEEGLANLPDGHSGFELYASKVCRNLYMGKGKDPEIALEFFDRGITSGKMDNSELARLYSLKADCYKKLQDTEAWRENIDLAIAAWNYSIENEPSNVEGKLNLATKYEFRAGCYEKIEAWREAKSDYERSYALSKNESTLNKIREMERKLK